MKRTGRPPLDPDGDESVPVSVKFPPKQYDDTYRRAQVSRCSVPEQIRRDVAQAAKKRNPK